MDYAEKPYLIIGRLIRNLRISAGYAQAEFAETIAINNSYLSRIENGERRPSPKVMKRIAEVLPISYDDLVAASGLLHDDFSFSYPVSKGLSTATKGRKIAKTVEDVKAIVSRMTPLANRKNTHYEQPVPHISRRGVPIFSKIPAGFFDEANVVREYDHTEQIVLTEDELGYDPLAFALRVKGDSMNEAGILEDDIVIVSPSTRIINGDIAAVRYGNVDITLKRFHDFGEVIVLQPCNSAYPPVTITDRDEVTLLGRVILVRRKLI